VVSDPLAELVARCQEGDVAAFRELVQKTQDEVYNLAYHVLGNSQEAEDIVQEVYLRVWRALPGFRGEARFSSWLYRITLNACLNRRRELRTQLHVLDAEEALEQLAAPAHENPVELAIEHERKASLWRAVSRLPRKYRLVLTMFYQQQLSYKEIAEHLALPLGTVKAHLNRARRALAGLLRRKREKKSEDEDVAV